MMLDRVEYNWSTTPVLHNEVQVHTHIHLCINTDTSREGGALNTLILQMYFVYQVQIYQLYLISKMA